MTKAFLLLAFTVGILAVALAVVMVLSLLPYIGIIGLAAVCLLIAGGVGVLVLGAHHAWDIIARKHIARQKARVELELLERELDFVRPSEYGHVTAIRAVDGGYRYTPLVIEAPAAARPTPPSSRAELEAQIVIPHAPPFREMRHLISSRCLVLCYTEGGPAYGTVDDLLSMAIVGKPGRGKTTALLYYVAMLLHSEAEVHVWDPHGSMNELATCHPNLYYIDRLGDIPASIAYLEQELEVRDALYKQGKQVKHPLLLLVDELPVIGEYEETLKKATRKDNVTLPTHLIKRFVLEARKWRCFFIASGQSTDAEILPTRVTENLSSRIIFFSSSRRARMAGLEQEAVKKFLPVLRRAGSGVMMFDCSSWDEPILGAIPETTVQDLHDFFFCGRSSPRRLSTPEAHDGFHHAPTILSGSQQTSGGDLLDPENAGKHSQQPVAGFPTFPTDDAHTSNILKQVAHMSLVQETSRRSGSSPEATGNIPETASPILDSGSGNASQVVREHPKTKAISRDLYHRIKAEYDRGTPKSEVCGRLSIGNDYYSTIRAMYQQFDLEKQQAQHTAGNPYPESEDT